MQNSNEYREEHWELIAKVLSDEANADEHLLFDDLYKNNPEFNELFRQARGDWQLAGSFIPVSEADIDAAWQKQFSRVNDYKRNRKEKMAKRIKMVHVLRAAASIAIVFALSFVGLKTYRFFNAPDEQITMHFENQEEIILPDGSLVTMNQGSTISYPATFADGLREVHLQGEAFFEVVSNQEQPFLIHTTNAEIKVLGTSFNVICNDAMEQVEVFVESGKVEVIPTRENSKSLVLNPGFIGVVSKKNTMVSTNSDENYMAWKTRKVIFKEAALKDVVKTLNKMYHTNIQLTEKIEDCRFTSTFSNKNLNAVLDIISTTFNLKIDKQENTILLYGEPC